MTGAALDLVMAALLAATCAYCFALNRRLASVREGQSSLESAIAAFDLAATRAQESLAKIELEGATTGRDLAEVIARADGLRDDLSMMVAAGDRVASRIEGAMTSVRLAGSPR